MTVMYGVDENGKRVPMQMASGGNVTVVIPEANRANDPEFVIVDSLAITDNLGWKLDPIIDLSGYEDAAIIVQNSLDQPVDVTFYVPYVPGSLVYSSQVTDETGMPYKFTIATGYYPVAVITKEAFPLLGAPFTQLQMQLQCQVAPTTGVVTAVLYRRGR